jgi:hypothetical protein
LQLQPGYAFLLIVRHGQQVAATVSYDDYFTVDTAAASHTAPLPGFYLSQLDPDGLSILTRRIAKDAHVPASQLYSLTIDPDPFQWRLSSIHLESFQASSPRAPILEMGHGVPRTLEP